jgi:NADH-quinone oxidoreductase subunit I
MGVGDVPEIPPRSRGVIALVEENCTVCMVCARECPVWCIEIDSHQESEPPDPARPMARARTNNVLDRFDIDYGVCMYCSICIDTCPFDALSWSPAYEYAAPTRESLVQGREELRRWRDDASD